MGLLYLPLLVISLACAYTDMLASALYALQPNAAPYAPSKGLDGFRRALECRCTCHLYGTMERAKPLMILLHVWRCARRAKVSQAWSCIKLQHAQCGQVRRVRGLWVPGYLGTG